MSLSDLTPQTRERLKKALQAELARRQAEKKHKGELEESLTDYHQAAWPRFDPAIYKHNWHIDALADHLTAVTRGHIRRLIVTEPPRTMKSSMVSVSWPTWTWAQPPGLHGPLSGPHVKFINVAYDPKKLATRDAIKSRRIIDSPWFQDRWSDRFHILKDRDQNYFYENSAGGFRFATSIEGGLTGEGGDILIVDDPINAKKASWESARQAVNTWWDETVPTRLNDLQTGAFVIIMQRLHEDDLVGHVLSKEDGWVHLNLPMRWDPNLDTRTWLPGWDAESEEPFFEDPRVEDGELLWPERFPEEAVEKLEDSLGPFAASAQLQQAPTPRGGGIIDRTWWQVWPAEGFDASRFPPCSLIIGSIDTRYGSKKDDPNNAYDAMTVWGVFNDKRDRTNTVMMEAWRGRLPLRGVFPEDALTEEERRPYWGLSEKIADTVRRRNIDILLIENKTRGGDLERELRRLLKAYDCSIILLDPEGNKTARMYAVQPVFADCRVYSPERAWAETVMTEVSQFPKSKFKDYCLVAGTLVATKRGPVPIEQVRVGDHCITPGGWRRVTAAGQTGVCPITTAQGITGTLDHPVFTLDRGYQRLDTVTQASCVSRFTLCDLIRIIRLNLSLSTVGCSSVWADRENTIWSRASGIRRDCTSPSGKKATGLFQKAMRSTISIAIPLIAAMRIWSVYRKVCIASFLRDILQKASKVARLGWNALAPQLLCGIGPKRAVHGIVLMPSPVLLRLAQLKTLCRQSQAPRACGVAVQLSKRIAAESGAAPNVRTKKAATDAESTNSSTLIMRPVFNVTVEGEGCYYANDVLVHNSDTVTQALSWLRNNGVLLLGVEADAENLAASTFRSAPQPKYDI